MKNLRAFKIIEYVNEKRFCSLPELMQHFQVSIATIHRDIGALVKRGKLQKVHGGVAAITALDNEDTAQSETNQKTDYDHYHDRLQYNRDAKMRIADQAIEQVSDGDIIFLDSSTTVYYFARKLRKTPGLRLTVVTNSLLIMREFPLFPHSYVLIGIGGSYDTSLNAFLGQAALRELERLSFDKVFMSAAGLDDTAFYSRHENLALFLQQVIQKSRCNFLLLDQSKISKSGLFQIASRQSLQQIICEKD